jgi:PPOX class probable F420-dependent enzyme
MQIPQTVRDVIEQGPLAHLTTLNPNGSPQVTVVWVGIEGDEFVMGHLTIHQKVRNIRRDPRVALSLLGYNTTQGMRDYVVVYGTARVTDGGAVPLLQRLAPFTSGRGRNIRRPRCATLPVVSPGSCRHASLGLVRGRNKPLADHESFGSTRYLSLVGHNLTYPWTEVPPALSPPQQQLLSIHCIAA